MSAWTPGPWGAVEWACHAPTTAMGPGKVVIAECSSSDAAVDIANARLIAAAPAMLVTLYDALAFALEYADVDDGPYGVPIANRAMNLSRDLQTVIDTAQDT